MMIEIRACFRRLIVLVLIGLLIPLTAAAHSSSQRTLRIAYNTSLQVLDPIITNSIATRAFGYMVFDVLIAMDSNGDYKPQMLESWTVSQDSMEYEFKLRPGLMWSDGTAVTAADCVASLERWGKRDGVGRLLMDATKELTVVDDATFVLRLGRPFGFVIDAIGKPAAMVPFMMPERLAKTPPTTQIAEVVGSGPYIFKRDEWRPGDVTVFHRNPDYVPRNEPADGLAGGKVVNFDRVEFIEIPDATTRVMALLSGEVDYLEAVPPDFVTRVKENRDLKLLSPPARAQTLGAVTINHTLPPFDDVNIRRVLQMAIDQKEVIAGLGVSKDLVAEDCYAVFMCGATYSTQLGSDLLAKSSLEEARAALKASSYKGEPIVILNAADSVLIRPIGMVVADQLRRVGFKVELKDLDWATVNNARQSRSPVGQGGWNLTPLVWGGLDIGNPLVHPGTAYNCTEGYPGWYCDQKLTPLLEAFSKEPDIVKRKALAKEIQLRTHENVSFIPTGQFSSVAAYNGKLKGVLVVGFPVLWNIKY